MFVKSKGFVAIALCLCCLAGQAIANCALIDRLDRLHAIQSRLATSIDPGLFARDIRNIRNLRTGISTQAATTAVDGNSLMGRGADIKQFLEHSRALVLQTRMDDPGSIRAHFTQKRRRNLAEVGAHLQGLRCTHDQIAIDAAGLADVSRGTSSDAEKPFHIRTPVIIVLIVGATMVIVPMVRQLLILRQRRARRRTTSYDTDYAVDQELFEGTIVDINCHGAKLRREADHMVQKGQLIEVTIADNWVPGTIVWSNRHYSGVQFRRSVALADVEEICMRKKRTKTQNGAPMDAAVQRPT